MTRPQNTVLGGMVAVLASIASSTLSAQDLPIDRKSLESHSEETGYGLTNLLSLEQVHNAIGDGSSGLSVDFTHVSQLLDGKAIDAAKIYGDAYAGPYPFESRETQFAYKRFRVHASIREGKATLGLGTLLESRTNSERWKDRGQIAVRFFLHEESEGRDRRLGVYDTIVSFHKTGGRFLKKTGLIEGPFVNLIRSDRPEEAVISFVTGSRVRAEVEIEAPDGSKRSYWDEVSTTRHEIEVRDLEPSTSYRYVVRAGSMATRPHTFRTAPPKGDGKVRFAYFGDSRAGTGGGLLSYMGVNYLTLDSLSHVAYRRDADFLIVGGDLVSGYTSVKADFEAQLHAWKQAITGFWNERPVYAAMGNHEALLKKFSNGVRVDRWPYDTDSAEAVFGQIFVHPRNGPEPSDPRRPTYRENVYSFDYGPVKVIAFNNNYWVSYSSSKYGGCPEGYLLEDQLSWIERELDRAQADPTVRYVLLYAQEPIFPNGGHIGDSMWHGGDNRVRAHVFRDGKVMPEPDGMVVLRNRFVSLMARHPKIAAVLGADEHAYHRTLIGKDVPIGDIEKDDTNRSGRIEVDFGEECSPLPDLQHNTWYIVCGGGGAPYYAEEDAPWNVYWKDKKTPKTEIPGHYYSSQENILLFDADESKISVQVLNPRGEVIDEIPDLMADK